MRFCVMVSLLAAATAAQVAQAPPIVEPTGEETYILELLNRFRADPGVEALRIAALPPPRKPHPELDWEMFKQECRALPKAPPLVFEERLMQASRNHADYMISNPEYGHGETPGKRGFTGETPADRVRSVGYEGSASECAVGMTPSPISAYWGMIVDDGPGGEGGMQAGRGHRMACADGTRREIGVGYRHRQEPSGRASNVLLLGHRAGGPRLAGGVIYVDLDGNDFYDPGEGVGGGILRAKEGGHASSWASGAFRLELASPKAGSVDLEVRGLTKKVSFPAGPDNVRIAWNLGPVLEKRVHEFLEKLSKIPDRDSLTARKIRAELFALSEGVPLKTSLRGDVDDALGNFAAEAALARDQVKRAIELEDERSFSKILRDAEAPFRGTPAHDWFREAKRVAALRKDVLAMEAKAAGTLVPKRPLEQARAHAKKLLDELTVPTWREVCRGYGARLEEIARGSRQIR